ncbi:hypothetical protein EIP91_004584 [Steccherinum ochraceum]|uniref:Protein kinase domain-containing protein n=1 Tax=Steccherinum ochraceum TaxID=92696 RepID=A0A4R0RB42_9APHY|nr:hypothetical protein EIP91_004584 [Steccherinum ochraceum]
MNVNNFDEYTRWHGDRLADDYWRSRYHFLASKGYTLRDHFHPDHTPQYPDRVCDMNERPCFNLPDGIDARVRGGRVVTVRHMETKSRELALLLEFSQPEMRSIPLNHCVPILTTFSDPDDPSFTFVVTPYVCERYDLERRNVEDIMNTITWVIEGLAFFHSHGISNVISSPNISSPDGLPVPVGWDLSKTVNWSTYHPLTTSQPQR